MSNRPPTLSEMQSHLGNEVEIFSPTLGEMIHSLQQVDSEYFEATAIPVADVEYVLEHYGIKGMKWGVRRSRRELGRVKNAEGEEVGGIRAKSRAAASKLKQMAVGEVIVLDTDEGGPKILVKQKDGAFKEATISADAERLVRTLNKESSEMSTREIKEATARAREIEAYNKIFNPMADPNAELRARVEAMELHARYGSIHAQMNPSRAQKVARFAQDLTPAFSSYRKADDSLNGALTRNIKNVIKKLKEEPSTETSSNLRSDRMKRAEEAASKRWEARKASKKDSPETVYNITTLGRGSDLERRS